MAEEKLSKFIINYLTEEQYAAALEAGTLNENDFYCTSEYIDGEESQDTGAGAVILRFTESNEQHLEKILSSIETYDDDINGDTVRLIKNIIYEWAGPDDGTYYYLRATGTEGIISNFNIKFVCIDHLYTYEITAHISGTGESATLEWIDENKSINFEVYDFLTSESAAIALSANQGRILNEKIEALEARLASLESGESLNVAVDPTDTSDMNLWIATS